jgi:hypothetical protein
MKDGSRLSLSMGTTRQWWLGLRFARVACCSGGFGATDDGVSHSADAIHQSGFLKRVQVNCIQR